jgi:hypothetical protein
MSPASNQRGLFHNLKVQESPLPAGAGAVFYLCLKFGNIRAVPKTRLVLGIALEKAAKSPLFPLNLRLLSQKLKFWESL